MSLQFVCSQRVKFPSFFAFFAYLKRNNGLGGRGREPCNDTPRLKWLSQTGNRFPTSFSFNYSVKTVKKALLYNLQT